MRIGAMLITDGVHTFQSFGGHRGTLRYQGRLEACLRALVYQEFDEILIALPAYFSSVRDLLAFEKLRISIEQSYVSLPITLSGGTTENLNSLIVNQQCIERISANSMLFQRDALEKLKSLQGHFGEQFIIANIVINYSNGKWWFADYSKQKFYDIEQIDYDLLNQFDEIVFHFIGQQGTVQDFKGVKKLTARIDNSKIILAGGMNNKKVIDEAKRLNLAAVLVDNHALYSEHMHAM